MAKTRLRPGFDGWFNHSWRKPLSSSLPASTSWHSSILPSSSTRKRGERVRPRESAGVEQEPGVGGQIRGVLCRCLCELPELASRRHGELWSCHETRQPRLASRRERDYGPPEVVGPGCYLSSSFNSSAFAGRHPRDGQPSLAWPGIDWQADVFRCRVFGGPSRCPSLVRSRITARSVTGSGGRGRPCISPPGPGDQDIVRFMLVNTGRCGLRGRPAAAPASCSAISWRPGPRR